jgi:hypothetical protein
MELRQTIAAYQGHEPKLHQVIANLTQSLGDTKLNKIKPTNEPKNGKTPWSKIAPDQADSIDIKLPC